MVTDPKIVVFICRFRGGLNPRLDPPLANVKLIALPCCGRAGEALLLQAFEAGAHGVLLLGCGPNCHFDSGQAAALQALQRAQALMSLVGLDPRRLMVSQGELRPEVEGFQRMVRRLDAGTRMPVTA